MASVCICAMYFSYAQSRRIKKKEEPNHQGFLNLMTPHSNFPFGLLTQSSHFRVLNGSGSFGISQSICANPSKGYLLSWYAGMTAPPASHLPAGGGGSSTGCTISFMLNDAFVPTTQPFCGPHASAPFDYGLCTEPSYDILTRYAQQSSRWRSTQLSNTIGFLFNCTASPTPGSNAQANLDLVVNAETDWTNSSLAL